MLPQSRSSTVLVGVVAIQMILKIVVAHWKSFPHNFLDSHKKSPTTIRAFSCGRLFVRVPPVDLCGMARLSLNGCNQKKNGDVQWKGDSYVHTCTVTMVQSIDYSNAHWITLSDYQYSISSACILWLTCIGVHLENLFIPIQIHSL